MTLQTVLRQHGITTLKEFTERSGRSRQHSWRLWHGLDGVGKTTALQLHARLGIPLEALLQVDPVPAVKRSPTTPPRPPGRPRKTPKAEPRPERVGWADGDLGYEPVNPEEEDTP